MLLMKFLTFRGPTQADSYMKRRIRARGYSLTSPSSLVVQFHPVLADFQLSSGCAPRPGTRTMLEMYLGKHSIQIRGVGKEVGLTPYPVCLWSDREVDRAA